MSDTRSTKWYMKAIWKFFASLDTVIYFLLDIVFKIFFNIVETDFITGSNLINGLYTRLQFLVGVFLVFKLSFSLISGLVDPDKITDKKNGIGNVIIRIVVSLTMFTLIIPMSGIPEEATIDNSYNKAIKEKGILFGTLSDVQNRIINGNVIGRLVLGVSDDSETNKKVGEIASDIVITILNGFVQPNVIYKDGVAYYACDQDAKVEKDADGYYVNIDKFKDNDLEDIAMYNNGDGGYSKILSMANNECNNGDYYEFSYLLIFSSVCGVLFLIIVAGFCIDIAIRLIKLVILQFIAPIPIISYIDPKTSSSFDTWVKTLVSVYLDLFLRLALIYFVVFICQFIGDGSLRFGNGSNFFLDAITVAVIFIGLFYFAKEAPKFIKSLLGVKDSDKGFFANTKSLLGMEAFGAKKLIAGFDSYFAGDGFRHGMRNVQGNGFVAKFRKEMRDVAPNYYEHRKGELEAKRQEKLYSRGKDLYEESMKNNGGKADVLKIDFDNEDYRKSLDNVNKLKKHMFITEDDLKDAELEYQVAQQSGDAQRISDAQKRYRSAKANAGIAKANFEKAKSYHSELQKKYYKDAEKENAFDLYSKVGAASLLLDDKGNKKQDVSTTYNTTNNNISYSTSNAISNNTSNVNSNTTSNVNSNTISNAISNNTSSTTSNNMSRNTSNTTNNRLNNSTNNTNDIVIPETFGGTPRSSSKRDPQLEKYLEQLLFRLSKNPNDIGLQKEIEAVKKELNKD